MRSLRGLRVVCEAFNSQHNISPCHVYTRPNHLARFLACLSVGHTTETKLPFVFVLTLLVTPNLVCDRLDSFFCTHCLLDCMQSKYQCFVLYEFSSSIGMLHAHTKNCNDLARFLACFSSCHTFSMTVSTFFPARIVF